VSLTEFLLARIAEDDARCRGMLLREGRWGDGFRQWVIPHVLAECEAKRQIIDMHTGAESVVRMLDSLDNTADPVGNTADPVALGIAQAALVTLEAVLKSHAQVFADHPDYDQAWTFTA
jgi:hypothetical protein